MTRNSPAGKARAKRMRRIKIMIQNSVRSGMLLFLLAAAGRAAIIQDLSNGTIGWQFGGAVVGQSFTADASVAQLSTIEIYYVSIINASPAASPTIDLLLGAGFGGPVLDSFVFSFAED